MKKYIVSLSSLVLILYMVHRGMPLFMKSGVAPDWFKDALGAYFICSGWTIALFGCLLDNVASRKIILLAIIVGAIGLFGTQIELPLAYGILFGFSAGLMKLAPFTSPMKLTGEPMDIVPQAISKNIGAVSMVLFIGTILLSLGWQASLIILSVLYLVAGVYTYMQLPDDKITGWKFSELKYLLKEKLFYAILLVGFLNGLLFYAVAIQYWPALKQFGYPKSTIIFLLLIPQVISGFLRYHATKVGMVLGWWTMMVAFLSLLALTLAMLHSTNVYVVFAGLVVAGLGTSIWTTAIWPLLTDEWSSTYVGTTGSFVHIALAGGSWLATRL
jgi:MFS family permease